MYFLKKLFIDMLIYANSYFYLKCYRILYDIYYKILCISFDVNKNSNNYYL